MIRLQYLKIEGQQIKELPFDMKNLVNLRTISLNHNQLQELPIVCTYYPKLYSLSATHNCIESIDHGFFNSITQVETVHLDNNRIKHLPTSIQKLKRPKEITYKDNPVEDSPEWLGMIDKLVEAVKSNKGTYIWSQTALCNA